jgi:hypothetical protein
VCMTIGLGMYFAWVHRAWPADRRRVGFWAAMGDAIIGAWLGFNATAGFLELATAIVGSAPGADLSLIALDIARDRLAETSAAP